MMWHSTLRVIATYFLQKRTIQWFLKTLIRTNMRFQFSHSCQFSQNCYSTSNDKISKHKSNYIQISDIETFDDIYYQMCWILTHFYIITPTRSGPLLAQKLGNTSFVLQVQSIFWANDGHHLFGFIMNVTFGISKTICQ